ncbi:MAG: hypothetical protein O6762_03760, partial [Thaumarchaeota archaeon]|nr:hypothetical protein [Nitrososphaerota archaeon]
MVQGSGQRDLVGIVESSLDQALSLGADDVSVVCSSNREKMVRFSNNSITAVKDIDTTEIFFYLAKAGRRILGSTSDLDKNGIKEFLGRLLNAATSFKAAKEFTNLPNQRLPTNEHSDYDAKISEIDDEIAELANSSMQASISSG